MLIPFLFTSIRNRIFASPHNMTCKQIDQLKIVRIHRELSQLRQFAQIMLSRRSFAPLDYQSFVKQLQR